jgi:hypothetical protein
MLSIDCIIKHLKKIEMNIMIMKYPKSFLKIIIINGFSLIKGFGMI